MQDIFAGYKLGFGALRLTRDATGKADRELFCRMVDAFIANGFCYFDTARPYMDGDNESAIRECLTSRHSRETYFLTNKLTDTLFQKKEDIPVLFESQLEACGVDYFDCYLLHGLNGQLYQKYKDCGAFEFISEMKSLGKARHIGISYHDSAQVLETILTENPQIELVQIQLNYLDYYDKGVQSRAVYEVCERFGKKVLIMEPCKGGSLARIPKEAEQFFQQLPNASSPAAYALRFAAEHPNVVMVLSGMADMDMLEENMAVFRDLKPLTPEERDAIDQVRAVYRSMNSIACTGCRYCTAGCPVGIAIPDFFACVNESRLFHNWQPGFYYYNLVDGKAKASDCIRCGNCEKACPQHLPIRNLLQEVVEEFETVRTPEETSKKNRRSLK